MQPHPPIRIISRASQLAVRQAKLAMAALRGVVGTACEITMLTRTTSGDRSLDGHLREIGGKGLFTKEIEQALLEGDADIAVHSMKDVATLLPEGLVIPCMLARDDVRDVLLGADTLDALPMGARVGTSSLRRGAQLLALRPDVEIRPFRGNIHTRLDKLAAGEVDATLLAKAGLDRMGITYPKAAVLDSQIFLPAVAQGAIGLQCRADAPEIIALLEQLNHADTLTAVTAEREMLRMLDGSCHTPIAGYGRIEEEGTLHLRGMLLSEDGRRSVTQDASHPITEPVALGQQVGAAILKAWQDG